MNRGIGYGQKPSVKLTKSKKKINLLQLISFFVDVVWGTDCIFSQGATKSGRATHCGLGLLLCQLCTTLIAGYTLITHPEIELGEC